MTDILPIVWSSRLRVFLPDDGVKTSDLNSNSNSNSPNSSIIDSRPSTPTSLSSTISPLSHTDKIVLPPSTLENLLSQISNDASLLPSPLLFRLTNPINKKVTHVGVREFSGDEGTVQIPIGVARNLELQNTNDIVLVSLVSLPKGSSLTLKVNTTGLENMDWKALLESRLHGNFTALTKGDILTISHPSLRRTFDFTIEKLEPENKSNAVCIIDTDLDLDVIEVNDDVDNRPGVIGTSSIGISSNNSFNVASGSNSSDSNHESSEPIAITINNDPLEVSLSSSQLGKFTVEINKETFTSPLLISPENISIEDPSSLLIFIGIDKHNTTEESFLWSNLASPGSSVKILPTDPYLPTSSPSSQFKFYILIRSELSSTSFSLNITTEENDFTSFSSSSSSTTSTTECSNCHQQIPSQSLLRHIAFCERNNLLCPDGCGKVFHRREGIPSTHWHCKEHSIFGDSEYSFLLHNRIYHTPITCEGCQSAHPNKISLAQHKSTDCPAKLHICKFCHLLLPQEQASPVDTLQGLTGHESYCGNRTTDCEICKKAVRLRDFQTHLEFHKLQRSNEPIPVVCSNINCPRLVLPSTASNPFNLCSICYGPLHSTLLDPTGSKLKQRIERRYVIQLTRGCGKPWCMNEYCASTKPQKRTMVEIMNTDIKFLLEREAVNEFYFCVDETSTKRQLFIQFESQNDSAYTPNILAKAIEQAKGNESEARRWLQVHAA